MALFVIEKKHNYVLLLQHLYGIKKKNEHELKEWESFLIKILESEGLQVERIQCTDLRDFIIEITPKNIDLDNIEIQNKFLPSLLKELDNNRPISAHFQEFSLGDITVNFTEIFESGKQQKSLYLCTGSTPIDHGQHKGLDKLYDLSRDFCKRRIKGEKYPGKNFLGNTITLGKDDSRVFFTKERKDADTSVAAGVFYELQGIGDSAKRALDPIWDEAQRFIRDLPFLNTELGDIHIDIDVKDKTVAFILNGEPPNKFLTSNFNLTTAFLGKQRPFRKFTNSFSTH